jgi:para-aminobenzoate synthetase component I
VLNWLQRFSTFCFLDNHQYQIAPHTQECLIAAGAHRKFQASTFGAIEELQAFIDERSKGWLFGHLNYDLPLTSPHSATAHADRIQFPELFFFEPEILIRLGESSLVIDAMDPQRIFNEIEDTSPAGSGRVSPSPLRIENRLTREEYVSTVEKLRQHILRGDCYEINFCQEFFAKEAEIDPVEAYHQLSVLSPNPFSALYRLNDKWLICASPERFLKKQGNKILSQPIKGTLERKSQEPGSDTEEKAALYNSSKDRSENVMVVDLVRNDLSKVCEEGTVKVDELYGVYSFPHVHQMISTVSGVLKEGMDFSTLIKATFPMGSMTGAPKKRVMELIDQYEVSKRGIFSGAVGYISPDGDFDFNVVIRSIMFNAGTHYLSFMAGSGITFYSDPELEWDECMIKAAAIQQILGNPQIS